MLQPLLDRIEIINVPAYLPVEKMNIAKNYLVPKFEQEYGFNEGSSSHEKVQLTDASIMEIINKYCGHEAGVRNLRKCIDRIFRKIVAKLETKAIQKPTDDGDAASAGIHGGEDSDLTKEYQINTKNLERFLDVSPTDDNYFQNINKLQPPGCSNGLAYVDDGYGAVLKIQFVKKQYGKKSEDDESAVGSVTHTGRLGDVMKESLDVVKIAVFNYIQQHKLKEKFDKEAFHLHVPMGATPKDGPSAGTSLFAALMSIATD
jgi:ATP-dependent Lon protease